MSLSLINIWVPASPADFVTCFFWPAVQLHHMLLLRTAHYYNLFMEKSYFSLGWGNIYCIYKKKTECHLVKLLWLKGFRLSHSCTEHVLISVDSKKKKKKRINLNQKRAKHVEEQVFFQVCGEEEPEASWSQWGVQFCFVSVSQCCYEGVSATGGLLLHLLNLGSNELGLLVTCRDQQRRTAALSKET